MDILLVRVGSNEQHCIRYPLDPVEHLGLGYLASSLRATDLEVRILDAEVMGWTNSRLAEELSVSEAQVVGISMTDGAAASSTADFLTNWAPHIKRKARHVTLGGHFATRHASRILNTFPVLDSVVLYEAEETFVDLVCRIISGRDWKQTHGITYRHSSGIVKTHARQAPLDLDLLPFPARDTLPLIMTGTDQPSASVLSSRGCHRNCTFCSVRDFFGYWRPRSPDNVVKELEELASQYGIQFVDFLDDNFIGPGEPGRARARAISQLMQQKELKLQFRIMCSPDTVDYATFSALKSAGLYSTFLGIESGVNNTLRRFRKGSIEQNKFALEILDRLDLLEKSRIGFIMFDDRTTFTDLYTNIDFLRNHVRYLHPGALTNVVQDYYGDGSWFTVDGVPEINLREPIVSVKAAFSIIVAHVDNIYRLIIGQNDPDEDSLLHEWSCSVLELAEEATRRIEQITINDNGGVDALRQIFEMLNTEAETLSESITNRIRNFSGD